MKCRELFDIVENLQDTYVSVWEDVCNLESPTMDKKGVDAVGEYFINMARQKNWQVEVMEDTDAGNAVCITLNPEAKGEKITLSGHIDTVHPVGLFGQPAVRRDKSHIYGPGVADCKGGVVACFMAMDALCRCNFTSRPVQLIIQTDEETGSKLSNKRTLAFMCEKAKGSIAFLNTESSETGTVSIQRKGILRCRFHVHGVAAHSSKCYLGANAVAEAAHKLLELEKMKDPDGLTCNCGVIQGGTVANSVAAECSFLADIRFADEEQYEQALKMLQAVAANTHIPGCTCDLERVSCRPAMPLTDKNIGLLGKINEIFVDNGMSAVQSVAATGGSDAAYITRIGVPCVDCLGVQGRYIHSVKEQALISSLALSAKQLAAIAYCI